MLIPSYQIKNILKLYSSQLASDKIYGSNKSCSKGKIYSSSRALSYKGKRETIIDRVSADIVDKIVNKRLKEKPMGKITDLKEKRKDKNQFTFTRIDENNKKTSHTIETVQTESI